MSTKKPCSWVQDKLWDFPEHLVDKEKKEVEQHLTWCLACKIFHGENMEFSQILQQNSQMPKNTRQVLLQKFRQDFSYRSTNAIFWYRVAALFFLTLTLSIYFGTKGSQTKTIVKTLPQIAYVSSQISYTHNVENNIVRVEIPNPHREQEMETNMDYWQENSSQTITITYNPQTNPEGNNIQIREEGEFE